MDYIFTWNPFLGCVTPMLRPTAHIGEILFQTYRSRSEESESNALHLLCPSQMADWMARLGLRLPLLLDY
jgi:hypothetical protein